MGRFYQTADAKFVDNKMFEAPHKLMAQVLQNKDKQIDDTIGSAKAYLEKLEAQVLTQDSPQLQEKIKEYQGKFDGIVSSIRTNPLNYNKFTDEITKTGRDLKVEWTTGKVGLMQQNKKNYDKALGRYDDYLVKNPTEAAYVNLRRKALLNNYQNGIIFDENTRKSSNPLDTDKELYKLDTNEDFLKDLSAKGIEWKNTTNGGAYIYTKNGKTETLTEEEIGTRYMDYIKANPHITNAANDWNKSGVPGFEDVNPDNSQIIKSDKNGNPILDNKGQQQLEYNENNYFGMKAKAAGRFRKNSTTTGNDIEANSTYQWSVSRADSMKTSQKALGATTEQIKLEGKEWAEANTEFLNGIKDFSTKYNLPKDYNSATPMTSLNNFAKSIKKVYGANSIKYKEAVLDLQKVYNSQQTVADKGYGVLIPVYGVEVTKQIMATAKGLNEHPETINLMSGTMQKFNPTTNRYEPLYYQTNKKGINVSDQKEISLSELKLHPEKYGLTAKNFNVQRSNEPEYDADGKIILNDDEEKFFTGTEKSGKHTPDYYVRNSLQPHFVPGAEGKPKGHYTYDLDIDGHIFRVTMPMKKFNIIAGVNTEE